MVYILLFALVSVEAWIERTQLGVVPFLSSHRKDEPNDQENILAAYEAVCIPRLSDVPYWQDHVQCEISKISCPCAEPPPQPHHPATYSMVSLVVTSPFQSPLVSN